MSVLATVVIDLLTGALGFLLGCIKLFREEQQRAYRELLPPILRVAYKLSSKTEQDQKDFNEALVKLWLYGSKEVAEKMDEAVSIIIKPERGDFSKSVQEAIVAMQSDIWMNFCFWKWFRHELNPDDVKHLYTSLGY